MAPNSGANGSTLVANLVKAVLLIGALAGTNGLQYVGVTSPARQSFAAVEGRCFDELKRKDEIIAAKDAKIEELYQRCGRCE